MTWVTGLTFAAPVLPLQRAILGECRAQMRVRSHPRPAAGFCLTIGDKGLNDSSFDLTRNTQSTLPAKLTGPLTCLNTRTVSQNVARWPSSANPVGCSAMQVDSTYRNLLSQAGCGEAIPAYSSYSPGARAAPSASTAMRRTASTDSHAVWAARYSEGTFGAMRQRSPSMAFASWASVAPPMI